MGKQDGNAIHYEAEFDEVHELARQISVHSGFESNGSPKNPFLDSSDPSLDPWSDHFDAKQWLTHLMDNKKRDPERYPPGVAGVSFRNLGAFGYGTSTDYQRTVLNIFLKSITFAKRMTGLENKTKIDILHDFDGLVLPGEICVVLGRPGSGCSTLLKSLAQNVHGYKLTENTLLNYHGKYLKLTQLMKSCVLT